MPNTDDHLRKPCGNCGVRLGPSDQVIGGQRCRTCGALTTTTGRVHKPEPR
jgi:hypothetical protein